MTENPIPWRVIRAAPDLLDACERSEQYLILAALNNKDNKKLLSHAERDLELVRAAIAKAKGELQPEERKDHAAD
jgi:hypothetical protein